MPSATGLSASIKTMRGKKTMWLAGRKPDAAAGEEEENVEVKQEEAKHDTSSESSRRITFLLHQLDILP